MKSINNTQKKILVTIITLLVIGVLLHNPLGGYDIPIFMGNATPCSDLEKSIYKRQFEEVKRSGIKITDSPEKDSHYIENAVRDCTNPPAEIRGPLGEWKSVSPAIGWFGKVLNLLTYFLSVLAIGCSGIFIFREKFD